MAEQALPLLVRAGADHHLGQGLAHLQGRGLAGGVAQAGDLLDQGHVHAELLVDEGLVHLGPATQVNAVRRGRVHPADQVLVELLRDEGGGRGQQVAEGHQHRVQGVQGLEVPIPEATAAQAHVPVAQVVHELGDGPGGAQDVVLLQGLGHLAHQQVQLGEHPAVQEDGRGLVRQLLALPRGPAQGQVGVGDEEAVGVPEGVEEAAHHLPHQIHAEATAVPRRAGGVHVPAGGVRAVAGEDIPGVHHIALGLAHLGAVRGQDVAQADDVLEGRPVEEEGAHRVEGVEPAAGLVHGLADVVRLLVALPLLLMLEGVVPLGHRHGAAVEPDIADLLDPAHGAAVRRGPGDLVHVGAVQLQLAQILAGLLLQLRDAADALHVAAARRVALPDGQGGGPVAVPAQGPVHVVLQPLAEAPISDVLRHPVDLLVQGHQPVLVLAGADVPGLLGPVDQGGVTAPAEGVGVLVGPGLVEQPPGLEILDDLRVRVLDELAGPGLHLGLEAAGRVHRLEDRQVVLGAHGQVVRAEGRGDVDDPRAVRGADELPGHHVGVVPVHGVEAVEGLVVFAQEISPFHPLQDLVARLQDRLGSGLGQVEDVPTHVPDLDVVDLLAHGQGHVARQGPGSGGPGQEVLVLALCLQDSELHVDAGVDGALLVAQGELVAAQRRAAAWAVGDHLVALVEEILLPELFQDPPEGLNVLVLHGHVGVLQVHPEGHALGQGFPLVQVLPDRLLAHLVEASHAVLLDLGLAGEPQALLHLQLHGQAVGVPAPFAQDVVALHGLVAGEHVLEGPGQHMVDAGAAVGCGRPLEEDVLRPPFPLLHAALKDVLLPPQLQDALLQVRVADRGLHLTEGGPGCRRL